MEENSRLFEIFLDVQSGLPRQGPGSNESTLKALSYCEALPEEPRVLDVGCGPGMQTLALANAINCTITAVDLIDKYLGELRESAGEQNISDRIEILRRDMNELGFEPESFDLIWAEGSAYIMGIENALTSWKKFLKPGGYIAFTELVWLKTDPPDEVLNFFKNEYPPMTDVETNLSKVKAAGYELIGNFTIPDSAWWDDYYTPLEVKLPALFEKYTGDSEAIGLIETTKHEIEMRRFYGEYYGYEFFIGRKA